ncbi:m-AAA protease-interacting protein 1, mitochondrial [Aquila chrysaetos chrysaetos]|uniref:Matrix AAA peptidase interacting protein 1 n=1 Tax=Aquila chrysaetos chrysaetos TaxID=223781 RepID=A0A663DUA1_AQUCH|nr:m-AAA protease-interacting protein 1, mitochondrial [Aquila chrysaetos chrysaetos]
MALRAAPGRGRWLARALAAPGAARVPPPPAAAVASALPLAGRRPLRPAARFASTAGQGPEAEGPQRRVVVVRITSPFAWLRTRFYYLLIRLYFDQEFSIEEFTRGAKQAFSVVSKLLSQRKLDLLDELVSAEVLQVLKEKISLLPDNHRDALAADIDAIMYTTEGDVRIYYDDDGRKFVSILMRFWYLNGANLPDEVPGETKVFQIVFGDESTKEKRHLLTANYEFQREFTEGAKPDWTITRIEHPRLLE